MTTTSTFERITSAAAANALAPLVDPSVFNDEIPALGESELAQFSKKLGIAPHKKWIVGSGAKEPDTMDLSGLLRARRNRTHGRSATKQRDEISSLHEPS